jgi:RNA 2',3'-cyclic 3'-phosphodiesterase
LAGQRLFVGIGLGEATRARIAAGLSLAASGQPSVPGLRWLRPDTWHLTLQFLGRVQDDAVAGVRLACEQAARATAPFAIELAGAGAFASARRARVIWIGVRTGHEHVAALAERLFAGTEPLGFAREQREFQSHLTVARLKTPSNVATVIAALHVPEVAMSVGELTLYRSHLSRAGAEYEAIARFPLGG